MNDFGLFMQRVYDTNTHEHIGTYIYNAKMHYDALVACGAARAADWLCVCEFAAKCRVVRVCMDVFERLYVPMTQARNSNDENPHDTYEQMRVAMEDVLGVRVIDVSHDKYIATRLTFVIEYITVWFVCECVCTNMSGTPIPDNSRMHVHTMRSCRCVIL